MSTHLRTLPRTVQPGAGETWHSWIMRLSARIQVGPRETLRLIGYTTDTTSGTRLPGYGITATRTTVQRVAAVTRTDPALLAATLLDQFDGGPLTLAGLDPATVGNNRKLAMREWAHFGTSTACPDCLVASDHWQLTWRLPWTALCNRHRTLHVSTCPGCGDLFNAGRRADGSLGPYSSTTIPEPAACQNPQPGAARTPRPAYCNHPHSTIARIPCSQPALLAAQCGIDSLLQPAHRTCNNDWWMDLRCITGMLLAHCTTDLYRQLLPDLPDWCVQTLEDHHQHRDMLDEERHAIATAGGDHRTGRRIRTLTATPTNPALIAPAQTVALAIMHTDLGYIPPGTERVDLPPVLDAVRDTLGVRGKSMLDELRSRRASTHLVEMMKARSGYNTLLTHTSTTRSGEQSDSPTVLQPVNIPRLFPWMDFQPVAEVLRSTGTTDDYARGYLSLCAAKILVDGTWKQAAAALDADPGKAVRLANAVTSRLTKSGDLAHVHQHVRDTLQRWQNDPDRHATNFRELAATCGAVHAVDVDEYTRLATAAGITTQATESRRRNYAAWQWHTVALMPLKEWPGWAMCPHPSAARDVYMRWLKRDLPQLHSTS